MRFCLTPFFHAAVPLASPCENPALRLSSAKSRSPLASSEYWRVCRSHPRHIQGCAAYIQRDRWLVCTAQDIGAVPAEYWGQEANDGSYGRCALLHNGQRQQERLAH